MLKKKYRLGTEVNLRQPFVIRSPLFTLRFVRNDLSYNRYGFIVSKRVDKRATVRNKLKRKMTNCVEELFQNISPGLDLLFVVNKEAVRKTRSEFLNNLRETMRRRDLLL